ncbi:N-acetylmuramoyl-L-alanine amidase [Mycobacterium spongiae]|uniref:N-acetylmuramoyl-L-alanine amidase n=1 Tax=Mycobacterium spongiae TaxID=886343 RepID=UPI001BA90B8D|nr:N-acetylmuramoyl-L-alanine amidase [Mycobacterium spongiae]
MKDDYARAILHAGRELGITPRGIVIAFATVYVESDWIMYANHKVPESLNLPHERVGSDGRSVGLFQQQVVWGNGAWWWGDAATCMDPHKSARLFFQRLARLDYNSDANSPGWYAQQVQRSAFPDRYDPRMSAAQALYNRILGTTSARPDESPEPLAGWQGDPVWLADVLREALGDRLVVEAGWQGRGNGAGPNRQMDDIWGVMIHHTGNDRETVAAIRDGVEQPGGFLAGPLAQCLIKPDGRCHLVAVGPCNHAGQGYYPGVGTNTGNIRLIGFECAWPTVNPDGSYNRGQPWPDAQIHTMRDAATAVVRRLGYGSDRVIGHKEYATRAPNVKWDPGNLSMDWFRLQVAKDLRGEFDPKPADQPRVEVPEPSPTGIPPDFTQQMFLQMSGRWEMLGWQTIVESLAEIRDATIGSSDAGKPGFTLGGRPQTPAAVLAARKTPGTNASATKASARKAPAEKAPAKKARARKVRAKKASAEKAAARG